MVYNYLGVIQMIKNKSIISKHSSLDSIRAHRKFLKLIIFVLFKNIIISSNKTRLIFIITNIFKLPPFSIHNKILIFTKLLNYYVYFKKLSCMKLAV